MYPPSEQMITPKLHAAPLKDGKLPPLLVKPLVRRAFAVRAQQVRDQRHPADTQHVAGQDAGDNRQATAQQGTIHRAGGRTVRVDGRR